MMMISPGAGLWIRWRARPIELAVPAVSVIPTHLKVSVLASVSSIGPRVRSPGNFPSAKTPPHKRKSSPQRGAALHGRLWVRVKRLANMVNNDEIKNPHII